MQESKKLIISKVIKELTTDKEANGDIKRVLERPHIQQMLKDEFQMSDSEIKEL